MKLNIRELKGRSSALVAEHRPAVRRLVLLYWGVITLLTLGSNGLNLYLNSQIGNTGGLDGMGLRSILQTIQEILALVNQFFDPFWSAGFLLAMIAMVRGDTPQSRMLTGGFRRFFPILGHIAFRFMVMIAVGMAAVNICAILFSFTPLGQRFAQGMAPILEDPNLFLPDGTMNLELIPQDLLLEAGLPLTALVLAVFGLVYLYLSYHFRLSMYLVVRDSVGAFQAHFLSLRLMRGHKWSMLRLDLSWWWYYLLVAVIPIVKYLDMILILLGLPLPMGETVMFFATIVAYCLLLTGLSLWKKCDVDASYVLAYEQILAPMNEGEGK